MNKISTFFRESIVARFLIPLGIILIALSVIMFVSDKNTKNYVEVESTVTKVVLVKEETFDVDGNSEPAEYDVTVKYTVDGNEYESVLPNTSEFKVGDKKTIKYNPENPSEITTPSSPILNVILLVGGIAALIGGIVSAVNSIKKHKALKAQEEGWKNNGN